MSKASFRYELLEDPKTRKRAQEHAQAIRRGQEVTAANYVDAGNRLKEARDTMPFKLYVAWLDCEFGWSRNYAHRFILCAERFGECDCLDKFQPAALVILSQVSVPEAIVNKALARARAGETITFSAARKLVPVQPSTSTPGATPRPAPAIAATGSPVDALRDTLDTFAANLSRLALSRADRLNLAEKFLKLAIELQQQPDDAPTVPMRPAKRRGELVGVN